MPAPDSLKQLVDRFDQHREAYRSGKYNETLMQTEEREAVYRQIMRLANEWAVYIPIYHAPARTAIWDRVHGFQVLPTGNFRLWEVWIEQQ